MKDIIIKMGRSGTGKSRTMFQEIRDWQGEMEHIILIPDTISHRTERELCHICGDGISLRAEVLTFSRLCTKVFHQCGGEHEPEVDKAGRMVLLQKSVSHCQEQLQVLSLYTQHQSFYEKLATTIEELKSNCVSTDLLFALDESLPQQKKIHDIALICGFYDSYTRNVTGDFGDRVSQELGVDLADLQENLVGFDPRDRMSRLAEKLEESAWGKGKCYWVDGFTDFTPQQLAVLEVLWKQGEGMSFCLMGDVEEQEDPESFFAPSYATVTQLREMVEEQDCALVIAEQKSTFTLRNPVLQHMEEQLFAETPLPYQGDLGEELRVFSTENPRKEVQWVASEIRRLVLQEGYRYGDFLVVARSFSSYSPIIATEFPRYEIPVFQSEVHDILEKPVISVVQRVLQALASNFHTDEMLCYLKTGFSPLSENMVDRVENYLLQWRETQWSKPWRKHTTRYDGNISWEKLSQMIEEDHPQYRETLKGYANNANELQVLNGARQRVMGPLGKLKRAMDNVSGKAQCEALYGFFKDISLYHKIEQRRIALEEEGNFAQSGEYQQLWDILCKALEQCHQLFSEEPLEFTEFAKIFTLVLSQYSVSTIPTYIDQVTAGETTRMKSNRKKVVFWMGCEESVVPMLSNSGGLLTDMDRALLRSLDISLNQEEETLLFREMTTGYEICALASERLYFSWARAGNNGQRLQPCFLIPRLQGMYPSLEVAEVDAVPMVAGVPSLEQQYPFVLDLLEDKPVYQEKVARIRAVKDWGRGKLTPMAVKALYGDTVTLSATGLRSLHSCLFSYFMRYGLGAKKREVLKFDGAAYGNMVHHTLEEILRPFLGVTDTVEKVALGQTALAQVEPVLEDYIKNQLGGEHNPRDYYLFQRMKQYVKAVAVEVLEEMRRSSFVYLGGEVKFQHSLETLCQGFSTANTANTGLHLRFQGSIDRVDGLYREDRMYLHTVDYKTGTKLMDFGEFYTGQDLQLFLYYLALSQEGLGRFDLPWEGAEQLSIEMAALSYLPGKTEVKKESKSKNQEDGSSKHLSNRAKVRHVGVYRKDSSLITALEEIGEGKFRYVPVKKMEGTAVDFYADSKLVTEEEFTRLQTHCVEKLQAVTGLLEGGDITANPFYETEDDHSCKYCPYANYCHYELGTCGNERRKKISLKLEKLWDILDEG